MDQKLSKKTKLAVTLGLVGVGLIIGYLLMSLSGEVISPTAEESVSVTVGKTEYQKDEIVRISIKNDLADPIFLGGCNQYDLAKKENDQWIMEQPLKMCVWEGYAVKINSKETADYAFDASKVGTFKINVGYAEGCEDGKPVSQANCKTNSVAYSAEFTVVEVKQATVGEDFLITLPADPSNGYSWTAEFDEKYLMLRSKDYVATPPNLGAGGTEVFTFAPIKSGETAITMGYGRPMDSIASEMKVFKYDIKEKGEIFVDYKCDEKVIGSGECKAFREGYEFDSSSVSCVKKGVGGCSFKIPFNSLEECQKACETGIISGNELKFETIKNSNSVWWIGNEKNYVVKNQSDWQKLWGGDENAIPYVDFNKDMVIIVSAFVKTGGYNLQITKIIEEQNKIEVLVKETKPGSGCMVTQATQELLHIVKVQKSDKEIVFSAEKAVNDCN